MIAVIVSGSDSRRVLLSIRSEGLPPSAAFMGEPRWAPDGQRFAFQVDAQIWVSNASGSRPYLIDAAADGGSAAASWSPDGEWIAYIRVKDGKSQLAKIRASPGASPIVLQDAVPRIRPRSQTDWSRAADSILYPSADDDGPTTSGCWRVSTNPSPCSTGCCGARTAVALRTGPLHHPASPPESILFRLRAGPSSSCEGGNRLAAWGGRNCEPGTACHRDEQPAS
jgi:hypothetical protein